MKLCTRHKLFVSLLSTTFLLFTVLFVLGYDSLLTTFSVINGVKKIAYTPIQEVVFRYVIGSLFLFPLWEYFARRNEKKIAAEPKLLSHRIRGYLTNGYFFLISLLAPLSCILTLIYT